jgi:rod shape-determining protein MreD
MHDRIGLSFPGMLAASVPFLCGVIGVILSNIPMLLFGRLVPPPMLAFMPVYFWCLVRPDLMPPPAAFVIGVLYDLLSGGQMGVWAAAFIVAYALVDREREGFAGLSGFGAILGFGGATLVMCATAYCMVALLYGHFPPSGPVILMGIVTVLFYVPGLWILERLHHRLIGPLRSDF